MNMYNFTFSLCFDFGPLQAFTLKKEAADALSEHKDTRRLKHCRPPGPPQVHMFNFEKEKGRK